MKARISSMSLALMTCAAFSGAVVAQQTLPSFSSADANQDGFLSAEELRNAGVTYTVDQMDRDDDDRISRVEYQQLLDRLGGQVQSGSEEGGDANSQ